MSLGPGDHARVPVEAHPYHPGDGVTFDAPVTSEGTDDVEAVAPAGISGSFEPGSTVVFHFDPNVVAWVDLGSDSELPARPLVKLARERGWTVQVISTPAALGFLDLAAIEAQTGSPVRSHYSKPGEPRSRPADAIIVAPATYNTINKWAQGISDTYALGILAETTALGVPIVVLPFVNSALAARAPFRRSVEELRREGVHILLGPGGVEPHEPHTGAELLANYPWDLSLHAVERLADLGSAG